MDKMPFTGQDAVITGAARVIGRACSIRSAQEGATVACLDVGGDADNAAVTECRQLDVDTVALHSDVTKPTSVCSAAQATMTRWDRLDVLVAAAGIYSGSPPPDVPLERWQSFIDRSYCCEFDQVPAQSFSI